jgi:hypothetical protein
VDGNFYVGRLDSRDNIGNAGLEAILEIAAPSNQSNGRGVRGAPDFRDDFGSDSGS